MIPVTNKYIFPCFFRLIVNKLYLFICSCKPSYVTGWQTTKCTILSVSVDGFNGFAHLCDHRRDRIFPSSHDVPAPSTLVSSAPPQPPAATALLPDLVDCALETHRNGVLKCAFFPVIVFPEHAFYHLFIHSPFSI
jgi:hypothetical protein